MSVCFLLLWCSACLDLVLSDALCASVLRRLVICAECTRAADRPPKPVVNLPSIVDPFSTLLTVHTRARSPWHVLLTRINVNWLDFKKLLLVDLSVREHLPPFPALDQWEKFVRQRARFVQRQDSYGAPFRDVQESGRDLPVIEIL